MRFSIDRFEGEVAVLIDEQAVAHTIPRAQLPAGAKAGDILRYEDGLYHLNDEATRARREQILRLQNKLRQK